MPLMEIILEKTSEAISFVLRIPIFLFCEPPSAHTVSPEKQTLVFKDVHRVAGSIFAEAGRHTFVTTPLEAQTLTPVFCFAFYARFVRRR